MALALSSRTPQREVWVEAAHAVPGAVQLDTQIDCSTAELDRVVIDLFVDAVVGAPSVSAPVGTVVAATGKLRLNFTITGAVGETMDYTIDVERRHSLSA